MFLVHKIIGMCDISLQKQILAWKFPNSPLCILYQNYLNLELGIFENILRNRGGIYFKLILDLKSFWEFCGGSGPGTETKF